MYCHSSAFLRDGSSTGASFRASRLPPNPHSTRKSLVRDSLKQINSLNIVLVIRATAEIEFSLSSCVVFSPCVVTDLLFNLPFLKKIHNWKQTYLFPQSWISYVGLFIEVCGWDFGYSVCTLGGIEQDFGFCGPARSFPGSSQAPLLTDGSTETRSSACIQTGVFFNIFFCCC